MSGVEILDIVKRILGRINESKTICLEPGDCITIYNPDTTLTWDANGFLVEIRITGKDENNNTRSFKKELVWDANGYLIEVKPWEEV